MGLGRLYMTRQKLLLIRIGLFAFACATLAFWYHALFIESSDLELKAETHMRMIEERREETKRTQHQIHLLEREVAQLKVDSELSSLLARTILGVVLPTESVYQLHDRASSSEFEP